MDRRKGPKRQISSPEMGRIKSETKTPPCKASPTKRQRACLPSLLASSPEPKARSLKKAQTVPEPTCSAWDEEPPKVNVHGFGWCNDPFDIDAETTSHYLEAFFDHVNTATYQMFPRRPFLSWARRTESKSPADLMMVYAMLAVGSVFSSKPDHDVQGSLFLGIAEYSVARSHGKFSLQLIHSRLLLALYHFSAGCQQESLDYSGMAIRAASGLRLNFESECRDIKETSEPEYGLNKHARAECRRRAFWSAYLIEVSFAVEFLVLGYLTLRLLPLSYSLHGHLNHPETRLTSSQRLPGLCSEHLCTLQSQDTYLRLPCEDRRYEEQECTPTPYFDNGIIDTHLCEVAKGSVLGPMALSIQISSIWSEILAQVFRSSFRSHEQYLNVFESFYNFTNYRLSSWVRSLPSHLTYSKSNAAICMSNGDVGSFINLHAIYHTAIIKLNRSIRNALLPDSILGRSIKSAIDHARQLLQMIEMMEETIGEAQSSCYRSSNDCRSVEVPFSNPFVGYAILSAVDVLSAGGLLRSCGATINLMENGLAAFKRLNRFWASARLQSKAIQERLDRLIESVSSKAAADKRAWKCTNPLDAGFGTDRDVFYSTEDRNGVTLLDHLESKITENEILIVD